MKVSYFWLKEFVDTALSPREMADRLGQAGFDVTAVSAVGGTVRNVVAARVESAEKHPNADKLKVCKVFDGHTRWDVVCGAPNAAAGGIYPFARVGAVLPGGMTIDKRSLRGVESNGMLCSARELALGDDHAGLYVLPADTPLGQDINDTLALGDFILEVEVTPNRPDALSHWGLAREIAASTGGALRLPPNGIPDFSPLPGLVTNQAPDLCSRYIGHAIDGVRVGPSPLALRLRLERCGIRAINNLVDVTNYVLLELGHPLHVFDRDRLAEGRVVVRRGAAGETLAGLDGVTRNVEGALVIADAHRPQALAGILGGQDAAVTDVTTRVLLESARFAPADVRRTRGRLNVATESSHRFERGTDFDQAGVAARRAAHLLLALAGGRPAGASDVHETRAPAAPLRASLSRLRTLLGFPIGAEEATAGLSGLGFRAEASGDVLTLTPPVHRADVRETADIAEEIARRVGYDRVPERRRGASPSPRADSPVSRLTRQARERLVGLGFWEARNSGLISREEWRRWAGEGAERPVEIENPLSTTGECLNPSVLPNLLNNARANRRRGAADVRLFETARVFRRPAAAGDPAESDHLAWVAVGATGPGHWKHPPRPLDIWDAKAWTKALLKDWRLRPVQFQGGDRPFLHPAESQSIRLGEETLGFFGRLHPRRAEAFDLPPDTFVAEFNLSRAAGGETAPLSYRGLSRQPALLRDFSLVFPETVAWSAVVFWIHGSVAHVEGVELFDVFTGGGLPAGHRSLGFRVVFRHPERTLADAEALGLQEAVIQGLAGAFGARLRDGVS